MADRLRLTLRFRGPLLVGGQSATLLADRAAARDPGGAPVVPASALKGALRIEFERLLAGLGQRVCHPSTPEQACPPDDPCPACQLFGAPGREGLLRFHDARVEGPVRGYYAARPRQDWPERPTGLGYALRPGVAISRRRRVAQEDLLFSSQVAEPPPEGELALAADIDLLGPVPQDWLRWLEGAAASLRAVGGGKSRGLGQVAAGRLEAVDQGANPGPGLAAGPDLRVVLVAEEFLRVGGIGQTANFLETLDYLPGSAVRGAIAWSFVRRMGGDWGSVRDPSFAVTNFYPTTYPEGDPKPIPLSVRTCKRFPSFRRRELPRPGHGCWDLLIDAVLVRLLRTPADGWDGFPVVLDGRCPECGGPLQPYAGFYLGPGVLSVENEYRTPARRVVTKTAVNRARWTGAERQLYTYELLDPKLNVDPGVGLGRCRFVGIVRGGPDALRRHLRPGLNLFVGGARFRGFGRVTVERVDEALAEGPETLADRLERFSATLTGPLQDLGHPKSSRLFFSVTLVSDLVLPLGRGPEWLTQELREKLRLNDLVMEKCFARMTSVGGFNGAVGLPKDLMPAVAMGSVFVFSCPDTDRQALVGEVGKLLRTGLGWRREEGHGRFAFCDELHLELRGR
jgi:CRISPR-associated protein Csx10